MKSSKKSTGEEAESPLCNPYGSLDNFMRAYSFKIDNENKGREADAIKSALKKVKHHGNLTILHQFIEDTVLEKVQSCVDTGFVTMFKVEVVVGFFLMLSTLK